MAFLHRDAAGHHGPGPSAAGQPAAGALLAPPLPLSRPAQPRAGRAAERAPRAESGRTGAARNSADDQRDLGGVEEYGVRQARRSGAMRSTGPGTSRFPGAQLRTGGRVLRTSPE